MITKVDAEFILSFFFCRKSLGDRLQLEERVGALSVHDTTVGSKQVTFKLKKVNINPKFRTVKISAAEVLSTLDETASLLRTAGGLLFPNCLCWVTLATLFLLSHFNLKFALILICCH